MKEDDMKITGFRILLACAALLASGCSRAVDVEQSYQELCATTANAEEMSELSCRVLSDTIDEFVSDANERRGAYVLTMARVFYQANTAGRQASWQVFTRDFGVAEDFFEPETRKIVGGRFNELLEAMYQGAGIDYGGDRRAFRQRIEEQLTSPEAVAFIDARSEQYMRQLME